MLRFDAWYDEKPVIVMSKTLSQDAVPEELKDKVIVNDLVLNP